MTPNPSKPISKALHPQNLHQHGYDFTALCAVQPTLTGFIKPNPSGRASIDFSNPIAVKALNAALLKHHYDIHDWDIPKGNLCPPIPGRIDYLHYVQDLIGHNQTQVKLLDIGTGANGIYALLASQYFGWDVVASDISQPALNNVAKIIEHNPQLHQRIDLRKQQNPKQILNGIIQSGEFYTVSVCNPPFHASLLEAQNSNRQKVNKLSKSRNKKRQPHKTHLNFGGQGHELWCEGGEQQFLNTMLQESQHYAKQCLWFTSLVSKSALLTDAKKQLRNLKAKRIKVIEMQQGNKISRILAWSFVG